MSKWFLLLNDRWKMLRWLTIKIKNYFYATLDDMCPVTWNKFLFKKKIVKRGSSKSLYPIQVTYDHLNSKASRSRMWTSQLLSNQTTSNQESFKLRNNLLVLVGLGNQTCKKRRNWQAFVLHFLRLDFLLLSVEHLGVGIWLTNNEK